MIILASGFISCSMTKSRIDRLLEPVHKFIRLEYTAGIVLFACVIVAIIWANLAGIERYHKVWEMHFSLGFEDYVLNKPLHVWINDGLMAIFFFLIGLELKREFIAGELSTFKTASLPMVAALGGMIVPAAIYLAINYGTPQIRGWGIPMATDIAFAIGIMSLAGDKVPSGVKVFLSALAVADDLGAVLVIAIFYTDHISLYALAIGISFLLVLWIANIVGVRHMLFYIVAGLIVWIAFLNSGIHATIAGVLTAFTIPARTKINEKHYLRDVTRYLQCFAAEVPANSILTTPRQHALIEDIKRLSQDAETPLQKIEYNLHPWVAFLIMPLFALCNAGIEIKASFFSAIANPVSMGIMTGLVIGKFAGVLGFTWLMIKLGGFNLPRNANWQHIVGVAVLAGVGFTMSLFVTGLAFNDVEVIENAKTGIFLGSLIAGIAGSIVLKWSKS